MHKNKTRITWITQFFLLACAKCLYNPRNPCLYGLAQRNVIP